MFLALPQNLLGVFRLRETEMIPLEPERDNACEGK
jgi:hypothetical protein